MPDLEPALSAVAMMSPAMTAVVARGISGQGCPLMTIRLIVLWGAVNFGIVALVRHAARCGQPSAALP